MVSPPSELCSRGLSPGRRILGTHASSSGAKAMAATLAQLIAGSGFAALLDPALRQPSGFNEST